MVLFFVLAKTVKVHDIGVEAVAALASTLFRPVETIYIDEHVHTYPSGDDAHVHSYF